jgi:hypothetical protein
MSTGTGGSSWSSGLSPQVSARDDAQGEIHGVIPITAHGEPGVIAFNVRYLLEYLAGKHGLVLMECNLPSNPARFTHPGSANMVLMPMFVKDGAPPPATSGVTEPPSRLSREEVPDESPAAAGVPRGEEIGGDPA